MAYDVIIVGAGIIGCACAREFALEGMRVAVLERSAPAAATTGASTGHVVLMDDTPAQLALTRYSRSLWQELSAELPAAAEYEPRGTLWVAADEEEVAEAQMRQERLAAAGLLSHLLDPAAIAAEEPNLRPGLAGGLLVPGDAVIYPPAAAAFFLDEAQRHGATLFCDANAVHAGQGMVRLADGTELAGHATVIATGADTDMLPWLPIQKRKGHLVITDRCPGFAHHQIVELGYLKSAHQLDSDSVAFNVQPRRNGQVVIGSSRQYGNEDPAVDPFILREMLARASLYMPKLGKLSVMRAWTGFRAATPDKLPLIGPTEDPGIYLAAGFEGLGITTALGAARLLADQLTHRTPAIETGPYLPERFRLAQAGRD